MGILKVDSVEGILAGKVGERKGVVGAAREAGHVLPLRRATVTCHPHAIQNSH